MFETLTRPSNRSALLRLEDFSEVKADRFGEKFLKLINLFCDDNSLKLDEFPIMDTDVSIYYFLIELTSNSSYSFFSMDQCYSYSGLQ